MKISDANLKPNQTQQIKEALISFVNQPSDKEERPCPGCRFAVGESQSQTSTEFCNAYCINAPLQMSSDRQRYPIEAGAVPIVYAFYTMRLLTPCWSCEGHNSPEGVLLKTPKIWFYSLNEFYAKLLAQHVSQLKAQQRIENHWTVKLLPFSQSMFTTTYSLEPNDISTNVTNLSSLQNDLKIIAQHLREDMHQLAHSYIDLADKNQSV